MKEKTKIILQDLKKILQIPKVEQWYEENMKDDNQGNTIKVLAQAVSKSTLTTEEAIGIAFLIGFQWNEKFEGTP